ncbi:hypothetical protein [Microbacterium sp. NPDC076911]|uniref:hypothetical protein n=1 Tax=Microbacterium sp. NPDC076911 TaxID=3154958 RepID=UPI003440C541
MDEFDEMAHQLEKLVRDPLADAVRGSVLVISVSEPVGRARYQACQLDVVASAEGVPATRVTTEVVTSRQFWPEVGAVLPARVSVSDPHCIEIDWDALAKK